MTTTAERELAAKQIRITQEVQRLGFSFGGNPDDPLAGLLGRFAAAVEQVQHVTWRTTATSDGCNHAQRGVAETLRQLEELYTTARPALEEAHDLLVSLGKLVEADERRRAGEAAEEARRRKLDDEVQRLANEEDAAEQAARRERLEGQARKRLADSNV